LPKRGGEEGYFENGKAVGRTFQFFPGPGEKREGSLFLGGSGEFDRVRAGGGNMKIKRFLARKKNIRFHNKSHWREAYTHLKGVRWNRVDRILARNKGGPRPLALGLARRLSVQKIGTRIAENSAGEKTLWEKKKKQFVEGTQHAEETTGKGARGT